MVGDLVEALVLATALGAGLVAGIFFAFSSFVMAALGRLPQAQGIAAMQAINVTVLNPWFFSAFFGTALGAVVLTLWAMLSWRGPASAWLLAGSLLYLLGCILVTIACNVPRNKALAAVQPENAEAADLWARYLTEWTAWNHVRTLASLAAAGCFVMALR